MFKEALREEHDPGSDAWFWGAPWLTFNRIPQNFSCTIATAPPHMWRPEKFSQGPTVHTTLATNTTCPGPRLEIGACLSQSIWNGRRRTANTTAPINTNPTSRTAVPANLNIFCPGETDSGRDTTGAQLSLCVPSQNSPGTMKTTSVARNE